MRTSRENRIIMSGEISKPFNELNETLLETHDRKVAAHFAYYYYSYSENHPNTSSSLAQ